MGAECGGGRQQGSSGKRIEPGGRAGVGFFRRHFVKSDRPTGACCPPVLHMENPAAALRPCAWREESLPRPAWTGIADWGFRASRGWGWEVEAGFRASDFVFPASHRRPSLKKGRSSLLEVFPHFFRGRHLSVRGRHLSVRGRHLSARGRHLLARGPHLSARGRHLSARGRHLSARGAHLFVRGRHLSVRGLHLSARGRHLFPQRRSYFPQRGGRWKQGHCCGARARPRMAWRSLHFSQVSSPLPE